MSDKQAAVMDVAAHDPHDNMVWLHCCGVCAKVHVEPPTPAQPCPYCQNARLRKLLAELVEAAEGRRGPHVTFQRCNEADVLLDKAIDAAKEAL